MSHKRNEENLRKLTLMMEMQDKLNRVVQPNWKSAGFNWNRAMIDEGAELMGHYGWKWWKKFSPDIAQCKLELIDIFHFLLSKYCLRSTDMAFAHLSEAGLFNEKKRTQQASPEEIRSQIDYFIHEASAGYDQDQFGDISNSFVGLCQSFELAFDEIFTIYLQKNVLNIFRQENGYKEGTYKKIFADGREDNEHLAEISKGLDFKRHDIEQEIKNQLTIRYRQTEVKQGA